MKEKAPMGVKIWKFLPVLAVLVVTGLLAAVVSAAASAAPRPVAVQARGGAPFPHMDHVFVIMMENTSYSDLLSPSNADTAFIRHLASADGLATRYYGVTHTSLPNYVAAISGSTWGSNNDDPAQAADFTHENLVDELDAAHVSWKAYMQSLPSVGYTGDYGTYTASPPGPGNALYVRKHDPFMLFPDIYTNPARTRNVVPLNQLRADLRTGNVPEFSWISPNVCDDMHGMSGPACPYASPSNPAYQAALYKDGNDFLQAWVTAITHSKAWTGNSSIFITWDEGSYADVSPYGPLDDRGCCDSPVLTSPPADPTDGSGGDLTTGTVYGGGHVPLIVVSRLGSKPATDPTPANHYSLLRTIEANWRLPYLEHAGDSQQVHTLKALLTPSP